MTEKKTNTVNVARQYLKLLKVKFTERYLVETITSDPHFPSLTCLTNTFKTYGLHPKAFQLKPEQYSLLEAPYIAYLDNQSSGMDFVLVTAGNEKEVSYISDNNISNVVTLDQFLEDWQGIIFYGTVDENSHEPDYLLNKKKEQTRKNGFKAILLATALLVLVTFISYISSLPGTEVVEGLFIALIKSFGLAVTILIMIYQFDAGNSLVKKVCTSGEKMNCDSILQSKAAKIFGISWGDVGFIYFAASTLFLLCTPVDYTEKVALLAIANILVVPYIFYSIIYQWRVAKQWCRLCLMVQTALAMELVWSIFNFWIDPYFSNQYFPKNVLAIASVILLPVILLYFLKPLITDAIKSRQYRIAFKRIINNPEYFHSVLQKQPVAPAGFEDFGIVLGNADAKTTIIKVDNPYCGPCAKAHAVLHNMLQVNDQLKLHLIFRVTNDKKDKRGVIARHLLALNKTADKITLAKAMDDWYNMERKDYHKFAAQYPVTTDLSEYEEEIEEMKQWCEKAGVQGTPAFYINGHLLPMNYGVEDLKVVL